MAISHLIIPDAHAHPNYNNKRAEWLGHLINDLKPTTVINIGDLADMPSLCSYDKGTRSYEGRTYKADIKAAVDFSDRTWSIVRSAKRKMPKRYFFEGNHEHRIKKVINMDRMLDGTIGLENLELDKFYDEVIEYNGSTPGTKEIDGILYGHYHISGVKCQAIAGENQAASLVNKMHMSTVAGHSHIADYAIRTNGAGKKIAGIVCGCYQDYMSNYAGNANKLWWSGVVFLHNVDDGVFDPQFISFASIKQQYGRK